MKLLIDLLGGIDRRLAKSLLRLIMGSAGGQRLMKYMSRNTEYSRPSWTVPDIVAEYIVDEMVANGELQKATVEEEYPKVFIAWLRMKKREFDAGGKLSDNVSKLPSVAFVLKIPHREGTDLFSNESRVHWSEMSYLLQFETTQKHFTENRKDARDLARSLVQFTFRRSSSLPDSARDGIVEMVLKNRFIIDFLDVWSMHSD